MEVAKTLCETKCLFCLNEFLPYIVAYTTDGAGPWGGSGERVEFTAVITPKLETVCTYLGIKLPNQSIRRARSNVRKRKKTENGDEETKNEEGEGGMSKESIFEASSEKFLCLPCFEKVNHLRILHEQLKDINQRIKELAQNVKRAILVQVNCQEGTDGSGVSNSQDVGLLERDLSGFSRVFGDHLQKVTERSSIWMAETDMTDLLLEIKQEVAEEDSVIQENEVFTSPESDQQNLVECFTISDEVNENSETEETKETATTEGTDVHNIGEAAVTRKLLVIASNICSLDKNVKTSGSNVPPIIRKQVFQCPHHQCNKCYASLKSLGLHVAAVHGRSKKEMKGSGRRFTLGDKTKIEEEGKTLFQCPNCLKKYEKVKALRNHIARNHFKQNTGTPVVTCSLCTPPKTFQTKERLDKHVFSSHTAGPKYKCQECEKGFHSNQARNQHVDSEHKGVRYKCSLCPKYFTHTTMLKRHIMVTHHNEKLHECHICAKHFGTAKELTRHMLIHDSTATKDHICHQCGKQFLTRCRLASHIFGMHKERTKQLECPQCQKLCKTKFDLNRHLRIHTGNKPFSCSICQRSFSQKTSMEIHVQTHDRKAQKRGRRKKNVTTENELENDND